MFPPSIPERPFNEVSDASPPNHDGGYKNKFKALDKKYKVREISEDPKNFMPQRQGSFPIWSQSPGRQFPTEIPNQPIQRQHSTPIYSNPPQIENQPSFQLHLDLPTLKKITTKNAEISLLTEYPIETPIAPTAQMEMLAARDNLARAYYTSMLKLVKDIQKGLPIVADLPINLQQFRNSILTRSDLLSRQNHLEFIGETVTNKLTICFPDETPSNLWTADTNQSDTKIDWRNRK